MYPENSKEIKQWLDRADKVDLYEFLVRVAIERDELFYRELQRNFKPQSTQEKLAQLKGDIDLAFEKNLSSAITYDEDYEHISDFLSGIVKDAVGIVAKKDLSLAIQEILLVFEGFELIELKDDDGNVVFDDALTAISDLAQTSVKILSEEQKTVIVKTTIRISEAKAFNGWSDYRRALFDNIFMLVTDDTIKDVVKSENKFDKQYAKEYRQLYKNSTSY
ncbi:hypothetical protein ACFQ22_08570 [Lentilactobacillus raoultii]|uniref:Uncharacterized protein n=1 Tax=Lentilactobacillus raoultii TaxID=1987503 RepID=A0ABW3PIV4_9LACO|nr:hypothetical protein [Lentilactobacillus raoultii]